MLTAAVFSSFSNINKKLSIREGRKHSSAKVLGLEGFEGILRRYKNIQPSSFL